MKKHRIEVTMSDIYSSDHTDSLLYILSKKGLPVVGTLILSPDWSKVKSLTCWDELENYKIIYEWESFE